MVALSMPANGPLSDPFGPRGNVPFSPIHHGQDVGYYLKTMDMRIFAAAPGTVTAVYYNWALGNIIEITHSDGTITQYCHLADSGLVNVGDRVFRRQHIGTMGSTGTEAVVHGIRQTHLHFVYIVNGVRVDPMPYMSGTAGGGTPIEEEEKDIDMRVYEDASPGPAIVNTGKFWFGAPGVFVRIENDELGGEVFARNTIKEAFGEPLLRFSGELQQIGKVWLKLAPTGGTVAGTFTPADRARLEAVPTALQNGQAARAEIVK